MRWTHSRGQRATVENPAPLIVSAGSPATLTYGTATPLAGIARGGSGALTYAWSVVSLPNGAAVSFSNAASPTSSVTLTGPNGSFVLRLTVTDSRGVVVYAEVTLTLNATTLAEILGSTVLLNYDATSLADGSVTSWPSTGSDTTAMAPVSSAPTRSATSFNGGTKPGVTLNGTTDELLATLSTPIPSGARPYVFLVAEMVALPSGSNIGILAKINTVTTASNALEIHSFGSSAFRFTRSTIAGADTNVASGPPDLLPHVFGIGFTTDPLTFAVDGAMRAGTKTAAMDAGITKIRLGAVAATSPARVRVAQFVVTSSLPSVEQISAVNALMRTKWGIPTTILSSTEAFDLTQVDASYALGNLGGGTAIGDYVYLTPWGNGDHAKIARWNVKKPFRRSTSWELKDLTAVGGSLTGFNGACNDGTFVYLSPFGFGWMRHDSRRDIDSGWSVKDLRQLNGGVAPPSTSGGVEYDGARYVYIAPAFYDDARGHIFVRHDTWVNDFESNSSYEKFDATLKNVNCSGYFGVAISPGYVYYAPYAHNAVVHGQLLRYNRAGVYDDPDSWQTIDLTSKNAALKGFDGVVCAGGKVYLGPGEVTYGAGDGSLGAVYDEADDFEDLDSFTTFDFHNVNAVAQGFQGPFYDRTRYIYYPQEHASAIAAVRADTQSPYASAGSYKTVPNSFVGEGVQSLVGGAASGQHRVFAPVGSRYVIKTYGNPAS